MKILILVCVLCFLLAGCAPRVIQPGLHPEADGEQKKTLVEERGGSKTEQGTGETFKEAKIEEEDILKRGVKKETKPVDLSFKDVLFDFDSYSIKPEYYPLLDSISEWLKSGDGKAIVIEGHCDERGTHEYNLILGQKRAEAVREYLVRKGVDPKRLRVISYGKERPLDPGHTEEAWAKNRRAHFRVD